MFNLTTMAIDERRRKAAIRTANQGCYVLVHVDPRDHEPSVMTETPSQEEAVAAFYRLLPAEQEVTKIFDDAGNEHRVERKDHDWTGGPASHVLCLAE